MLGLSCGIDYALFIASRHRANLMRGHERRGLPSRSPSEPPAARSSSPPLTVIVALCGLTIVGIPFLSVMGLAAAGTVAIALLIAITLLPALLGFAGQRVTRFLRLPGTQEAGRSPGTPPTTARRAASDPGSTAGAAWGRFVIRHRIAVLVLGVAFLGVVALPATRLDLGLPTAHDTPASSTGYKSYELTSELFGPGYNGPLLVVADLSHATDPRAAQQVTPPCAHSRASCPPPWRRRVDRTAIVKVIPVDRPERHGDASLVQRIRADAPAIAARTGARILVGGTTASNIDTSQKLSGALPVFLIVVAVLALALLTLAFRTILVPVKSIIGFLLSAFAAFGAEVAVFQWGWLRQLFGITPSQTISFLPILMLAIIFGLSSDYEVFLVSRIKEEFTRTGDANAAVEHGTGLSARVVTAAALIMFTVFAAFMIGGNVHDQGDRLQPRRRRPARRVRRPPHPRPRGDVAGRQPHLVPPALVRPARPRPRHRRRAPRTRRPRPGPDHPGVTAGAPSGPPGSSLAARLRQRCGRLISGYSREPPWAGFRPAGRTRARTSATMAPTRPNRNT